jgi:glycosyltransferase involved in cell wall biosynthesis
MNPPSLHRILIVAREFTVGGAAYLALRHMRRLRPRYEIDVLITGPCEEEMLSQAPDGVSIFRLGAEGVITADDDLNCLELFLKYRQIPPFQRLYLAVLATSVFPDWQACIAVSLARASRKLVFLVDEGLGYHVQLSRPERIAMECCIQAADLVLPVSRRLWHKMAELCPMLSRRPWQVLRPPVEINRTVSDSPVSVPNWGVRDRPVIVTVSRLSPEKQIMQCLQVHHRLRQAGIEFRWYVVGVGSEEEALRTEIEKLGMTQLFFLVGKQQNAHAWIKESDVFALLSSSEGCPTVVMEALLIGCPVIVTDVNGAHELIENGRTGLIVPNNAEAIMEGLSQLVRNAALRDRFRRNLSANPLISDAGQETTWLVEKIEEPVPRDSNIPKVSILIPTYNHEQYIDRTIASALMQNFSSLEVIVSDDASTDRTENFARSWATDPRFQYRRNERNIGRVANYRKALTEYARGEWVLVLDGDDHLVNPDFIRQAWEALERHAGSSPVFAQGGHRVYDLQGNRPPVDILPNIDGIEKLMKGACYLRFVYETGFFTHLGTLYNRRAAIENGFYTMDISSSDMDSLLRLALHGEVLVLNTIAGYWVQHGKNSSSNLPLDDIAANVRIFRRIARMAVKRRLISMPEIDNVLTRYETKTLVHLFTAALGKTAKRPADALKMLAIVISVNPRLILNGQLMGTCGKYFWTLAFLALGRCKPYLAFTGRKERATRVQ